MRGPWKACVVVEIDNLSWSRYDIELVDDFGSAVLLCDHASRQAVHFGGFKAGTAETSIWYMSPSPLPGACKSFNASAVVRRCGLAESAGTRQLIQIRYLPFGV